MDEYVSREELRRQACCIYSYGGARYVSLAVIEKMATADVAPVVHGRWDENGNCTNCGKHAPYWAMASTYYTSLRCPNCGAKMEEGR